MALSNGWILPSAMLPIFDPKTPDNKEITLQFAAMPVPLVNLYCWPQLFKQWIVLSIY